MSDTEKAGAALEDAQASQDAEHAKSLERAVAKFADTATETDEGGTYFSTNQIAIRGLQTAGADLTSVGGMQVITQVSA